jgi:predicted glutamine amidotransferase
MCRLFAAFSNHSVDAEFLLRTAPQSLLLQSRVDRKQPQGDGWGVGWFEGGKPTILKSPEPMYRDSARVIRAGRKARGSTLVGHVRWASNPLKLPKHELLGPAHTQPFSHGRWLFAHNGTLYIPREVAAELGPWRKYVKGRNDSEVLFYWLLKHLHGQRNIKTAVKQAILGLDRVWDTCRRRYPIYKYAYHGVNWVLTDGSTLIAFCYVDPRGFDKAKALCASGQPYYQLQVHKSNERVVVASEPLDRQPGWKPMRHGELLVAKKTRSGIRVQTWLCC